MIDVKFVFEDVAFAQLANTSLLAASKRAIRGAGEWYRTQLVRRMGQSGLPRKLLVARVRLHNHNWRTSAAGPPAVKVWFGINPVIADRLGKPRPETKGYSAAGYYFPTGFVPHRSQRYAGKLYHRTTSARLPITRGKVEIAPAATAAWDDLQQQLPARFETLLRRELNYEMHKKFGTAS